MEDDYHLELIGDLCLECYKHVHGNLMSYHRKKLLPSMLEEDPNIRCGVLLGPSEALYAKFK